MEIVDCCPAHTILRVCFQIFTMTLYHSADNLIEEGVKGTATIDTRAVQVHAFVNPQLAELIVSRMGTSEIESCPPQVSSLVGS